MGSRNKNVALADLAVLSGEPRALEPERDLRQKSLALALSSSVALGSSSEARREHSMISLAASRGR